MQDLAHSLRRQARDFAAKVIYRIAGLPISLRAMFDRDDTAPDAVIRRAYAQRILHPQRMEDALALIVALLLWPAAVAGMVVAFLFVNGTVVARRSQRSLHRQLFDQLRLYLTAGVLPPAYYMYELYDHPASSYARNFIYRCESKAGVMTLLKEGVRKPTTILNDKVACAEFCQLHQIATIPVLAAFRDGIAQIQTSPEELDTDLFVKLINGKGGKGAERWDCIAGGLYRNPAGRELSRTSLFERLAAVSTDEPRFVQPRIRNHPDLAPFANGALSTIRVLTCINEQGEPEVIGAAMRMAVGSNHTVDNLHAGGIAAAVDLVTGRLGPASNLGVNCRLGWIDRHPVSNAQIAGYRLPGWDDVREFGLRSHKAFNDRVIVGWDIAITGDGPILVEANGGPDLDIIQRVARHGMMASRLGILLAFHLSQLGLDNLTVF
ncbi:MAG: sugar-transfer associated ATP-grasp domain-containing protein [Sphingomicrobium sp.]